jgi:signal transduction histidine kinase
MRWPIRSQLLLPPLLLLLGVAGISVGTAASSAHQARQQIEARLRSVARFLGEESRFRLTRDVLRHMKLLSGADYLLIPREGQPLTSLERAPAELPAGVVGDWHTLQLGPPVPLAGQTYLCSGIRLRQGPNTGDTLYILYPESLWRDARWEAIWPALVLGGSLGLASLALAVGVARGLSRRVRQLERRTRLIAAGDFSPLPLPGRDDELRDLAGSINEMADRLAQFQKTAQQTERLRLLGQVSGGLAHQLRNGLTGARLAVQLYLHEQAGQADASALEVALRQLTLLESHLKRFLDLGRSGPVRRAPCVLTALVSEAVDLLVPQCRHAGITLRWQPPAEPHVLEGDPGQLAQLVLNVLGNAVEAAGPGGEVEVTLTQQMTTDRMTNDRMTKGRIDRVNAATTPLEQDASSFVIPESFVILEVCDSGPGPPAAIADRLFEPFVTGKAEGVGLGLAVARQVAEAHGGRINWERLSGRTCFRIELPASAALERRRR